MDHPHHHQHHHTRNTNRPSTSHSPGVTNAVHGPGPSITFNEPAGDTTSQPTPSSNGLKPLHLSPSHSPSPSPSRPATSSGITRPFTTATNAATAHLAVPGIATTTTPKSTTTNRLAPSPSSHSLASTSARSEAWTVPEDSEGEYIRKTYLHFDRIGVKGDGHLEGTEWTRHRTAGETPWGRSGGGGEAEEEVLLYPDQGDPQQQRFRTRSSPAPAPRKPSSAQRPPPSSSSSSSRPVTPLDNNATATTSAAGVRGAASTPALRASSMAATTNPKPSPLATAPPTTAAVGDEEEHNDSWDTAAKARRRQHPHVEPSPAMTSDSAASLAPMPTRSRISESELSDLSDVGTEEWNEQREMERRKRDTLSSRAFGALVARAQPGILQEEQVQGEQRVDEGQYDDDDGDANTTATNQHWSRVDRYGFFSKDWGSQHGRTTLLPAACFDYVPTPARAAAPTKRTKGELRSRYNAATAASKVTRSVTSSEASTDQPNGHAAASTSSTSSPPPTTAAKKTDSIAALRQAATDAHRAKEASRISKWAAMLEPGEVRGSSSGSGGNVAYYRIRKEYQVNPRDRQHERTMADADIRRGRHATTLERRVWKGIPDRWRAAAWWALVEMNSAAALAMYAGQGEGGGGGGTETQHREHDQDVGNGNGNGPSASAPALHVPEETSSSPQNGEPPIAGTATAPREGLTAAGLAKAKIKRTLSSKRRVGRSASVRSRLSAATRASPEPEHEALPQPQQGASRRSRRGRARARGRGRRERSSPLAEAALRRRTQDHFARFTRLLSLSSPHDVQIDLDVPRTIANHVQFHTRYGAGQRSLFKVLHCFSLLCAHCGYCQGMGSLAAVLLCYLPEEAAYSLLVSLHDSSPSPAPTSRTSTPPPPPPPPLSLSLHSLFSPGFPGLMRLFTLQESLLALLLPDLSATLQREGIVSSAYATRWYITLWHGVLPFETQLRLWDIVLLLGEDVCALFAVAILHALDVGVWAQAQTTAGAQAGTGQGLDFELIMSTLNTTFVPEDDDALFRWVERMWREGSVQGVLRGGGGGAGAGASGAGEAGGAQT